MRPSGALIGGVLFFVWICFFLGGVSGIEFIVMIIKKKLEYHEKVNSFVGGCYSFGCLWK